MQLFRFDTFDEICLRLSDAVERTRVRTQMPSTERSRIDDFLTGMEDAQWRIAGMLQRLPVSDRPIRHD